LPCSDDNTLPGCTGARALLLSCGGSIVSRQATREPHPPTPGTAANGGIDVDEVLVVARGSRCALLFAPAALPPACWELFRKLAGSLRAACGTAYKSVQQCLRLHASSLSVTWPRSL
jgi:hypothetical protein